MSRRSAPTDEDTPNAKRQKSATAPSNSAWVNSKYEFTNEYLTPMVTAKDFAFSSNPIEAAEWAGGRGKIQLDITANAALYDGKKIFDPFDNLDDYEKIFITMKAPDCIKTWQSDYEFAQQRLSGLHPNFIKAVPQINKKYDLSKVQNSANRLGVAPNAKYFECDWSEKLQGTHSGDWKGIAKFLHPCAALFSWVGGADGDLVAVAIRLDDSSGSPLVTVTPQDKNWKIAKVFAQVADVAVHEMSAHLYGAHFFQEPLAVATGRYLPENHILSRFLHPHFKFLLENNALGKKVLVNKGGSVDQLLAPTLQDCLNLVVKANGYISFTNNSFERDIANRGVDINTIPNYPWRDDGRLLWNAIGKFVAGFTATIYHNNIDAIRADQYIMAWWNSLVNECHIPDVPSEPTIDNFNFILQRIIFTAGPYHSSINYPQYEYLAFALNQPAAAYAEWDNNHTDKDDLQKYMPPYGQTMKQLELPAQLALYRFDTLGHFDKDYPSELQSVVDQFQLDLTKAENVIKTANKSRRIPYIYMMPSNITNSTSI